MTPTLLLWIALVMLWSAAAAAPRLWLVLFGVAHLWLGVLIGAAAQASL